MNFFKKKRPCKNHTEYMNTCYLCRDNEKPKSARFRIVKEEWPSGTVKYWVEEWTSHYACDDNLWLPVDFPGMSPSCFSTLEAAQKKLDEVMKPIPVPHRTVVEER